VLKHLREEFPMLSQAEEFFEADYFSEEPLVNISSGSTSTGQDATCSSTPKCSNRFSNDGSLDSLSPLFFSPTNNKSTNERSCMTVGDVVVEVCSLFRKILCTIL